MSDAFTPERFTVDVPGGELLVARWGSGETVVIAAHGVTATHMGWPRLAEQLGDDVTLLAPDLRGRGGSRDIEGPFGIPEHADDLARVLDHEGVARAIFLGHSMGGFVVSTAAVRHPERVAGLVIADGAIRLLEPPPDVDVEALLHQIIGPSLDRLRMTFPSVEAYREFWRAHPALARDCDAYVEAYVDYDLIGEPAALHSGVREDAVLRDSADTLMNDEVIGAIGRIAQPAIFVRSERGVMNDPTPLYETAAVAAYPHLTDVFVPDTNHFTLLLGEAGARALADAVRTVARA